MNIKKLLFTVITVICLPLFSFSTVPANINSGNPTMPFPQFIDYPGGYSLASHLPDGVTLAEMEKYMRDAWQIYANQFETTGDSWGGVNYLWDAQKIGAGGCGYDCAEADGYALIAAAVMADKPIFDALWMRFHDLRLL